MHKLLNQEIQALKEDLEKREQDIVKYKSNANLNTSITSSNGSNSNTLNHHHHSSSNGGSNHGTANSSMLQLFNGGANLLHHHLVGSPLNSSAQISSYSSLNQFDETMEHDSQDRLESWLSIPNKRNIKKHGWKKLYVVLRKGKLFFYNSLRDMKESQEPYMTIDLE